MPRQKKSLDDQIAALKKKEDQFKARRQQKEARKREIERREDTRRKVLIGAIAMAHAEANPDWGFELHRAVRRSLTRPHDKALFPELFDDPYAGDAAAEQDTQPSVKSAFADPAK